MAALPNSKMSEAEYLAFERMSESRHEYFNGVIFEMEGASRSHSLIKGSTCYSLYTQTQEHPCEIYATDMRLKILATGFYSYPDICVVLDEGKFTDTNNDVLTNPTLIIEVLSPSTESYDRGKKFLQYSMIPDLQEYVLISQDTARIESFLRQEKGKWEYVDARGLEASIQLTSINCSLKLADVYRKIVFPLDTSTTEA